MIQFGQVSLTSMVIHLVGNKLRQEGIRFSEELAEISDETMQQLLFSYLLRPFVKIETLHHFAHPTSLEFNEVYHYVAKVFADRTVFLNQSKNVARQLYESSTHPRIREGEFFMIYLENCVVGDVTCDAIGIFRTENKETYLKVLPNNDSYGMAYDHGISTNHLDKGCLIFNVAEATGYRAAIVDVHSKATEEARYWRDAFLKVEPLRTEATVTQDYMRVCAQVQQQNNRGRGEQLAFQAKAIQYFESNDTFELEGFVRDVIGDDPDLSERFEEVRSQIVSGELQLPERFDISREKVQKFRRQLRNHIRLDNNFEIVIKGRDLEAALKHVERGFDEAKSQQFYKLYFNHEQ